MRGGWQERRVLCSQHAVGKQPRAAAAAHLRQATGPWPLPPFPPAQPHPAQRTSSELSACCSPAVCTLSSRIDARSASSLPSSWLQIMEPMRSLPAGWMPYSLGMTAAASARAVCRAEEGRAGGWSRL